MIIFQVSLDNEEIVVDDAGVIHPDSDCLDRHFASMSLVRQRRELFNSAGSVDTEQWLCQRWPDLGSSSTAVLCKVALLVSDGSCGWHVASRK